MGRGGHRSTGPRTLAPLLRERVGLAARGRSWSRPLLLRRFVAASLMVLAAALALRPAPDTVPVLVASHDIAPGSTLSETDVAVWRLPAAAAPDGAITDRGALAGRVMAAGARTGEPFTDVSLTGPELVALQSSAAGVTDAATVPVRLADPDVAALLAPGATVDVVSAGERDAEPTVLAERATVVTVLDEATGGPLDRSRRGRLVVVLLSRDAATRVAAASLSQPLTVTLRQGRR